MVCEGVCLTDGPDLNPYGRRTLSAPLTSEPDRAIWGDASRLGTAAGMGLAFPGARSIVGA